MKYIAQLIITCLLLLAPTVHATGLTTKILYNTNTLDVAEHTTLTATAVEVHWDQPGNIYWALNNGPTNFLLPVLDTITTPLQDGTNTLTIWGFPFEGTDIVSTALVWNVQLDSLPVTITLNTNTLPSTTSESQIQVQVPHTIDGQYFFDLNGILSPFTGTINTMLALGTNTLQIWAITDNGNKTTPTILQWNYQLAPITLRWTSNTNTTENGTTFEQGADIIVNLPYRDADYFAVINGQSQRLTINEQDGQYLTSVYIQFRPGINTLTIEGQRKQTPIPGLLLAWDFVVKPLVLTPIYNTNLAPDNITHDEQASVEFVLPYNAAEYFATVNGTPWLIEYNWDTNSQHAVGTIYLPLFIGTNTLTVWGTTYTSNEIAPQSLSWLLAMNDLVLTPTYNTNTSDHGLTFDETATVEFVLPYDWAEYFATVNDAPWPIEYNWDTNQPSPVGSITLFLNPGSNTLIVWGTTYTSNEIAPQSLSWTLGQIPVPLTILDNTFTYDQYPYTSNFIAKISVDRPGNYTWTLNGTTHPLVDNPLEIELQEGINTLTITPTDPNSNYLPHTLQWNAQPPDHIFTLSPTTPDSLAILLIPTNTGIATCATLFFTSTNQGFSLESVPGPTPNRLDWQYTWTQVTNLDNIEEIQLSTATNLNSFATLYFSSPTNGQYQRDRVVDGTNYTEIGAFVLKTPAPKYIRTLAGSTVNSFGLKTTFDPNCETFRTVHTILQLEPDIIGKPIITQPHPTVIQIEAGPNIYLLFDTDSRRCLSSAHCLVGTTNGLVFDYYSYRTALTIGSRLLNVTNNQTFIVHNPAFNVLDIPFASPYGNIWIEVTTNITATPTIVYDDRTNTVSTWNLLNTVAAFRGLGMPRTNELTFFIRGGTSISFIPNYRDAWRQITIRYEKNVAQQLTHNNVNKTMTLQLTPEFNDTLRLWSTSSLTKTMTEVLGTQAPQGVYGPNKPFQIQLNTEQSKQRFLRWE